MKKRIAKIVGVVLALMLTLLPVTALAADGDVAQVGKGEFARGMGAHIQCLNAEIDGVGSSIEGSGQRFTGTRWCHDFYGFAVDINRIHERMD